MSTPLPAAAGSENVLSKEAKRTAALRLLRQALQLLDESNAAPELGARLEEVIRGVEASIHRSVRGG